MKYADNKEHYKRLRHIVDRKIFWKIQRRMNASGQAVDFNESFECSDVDYEEVQCPSELA